jgi:hypothetical protein
MDTIEEPKPGKLLPRLTAALLFVLGAYIIVGVLQALWNMLKEDSFSFFILFFIAIAFAVGIYLIRLSFNVWSKITANLIRQISIVAAISIDIFALSSIPESFRASDPMIINAITMAIAGISYLIICRFLFKLYKTQRTPVSKGLASFFNLYLTIISLNIFILPTIYYKRLMEGKKDSSYELLIFPLSIIAAIIFYKVCTRYMKKNTEPLPDKEITPQLSQ